MTRKKNAGKSANTNANLLRTKLHKRAGDAVEILTGPLEAFAEEAVNALHLWQERRDDPDADNPHYYFDSARELAQECARLGQTIAAIKGESHNHLQHIRVERLTKSGANAVSCETGASAKLLEQQTESEYPPENGGEGGDRE